MKRYMKQIGAEWEQLLFWVTLVLLLTVLALWLAGFGQRGGEYMSKREAPPARSLLGPGAFAFLNEPSPSELAGEKNPFALTIDGMAPKKRFKPWQRQENTTTTVPPKDPPKPRPFATVTKPEAKPPAEKPKPAPQPKPQVVRLVEYRGTMTTTSGEKVALVQTQDPVAKKESLAFVRKGGEIGGLKVVDFSETAVEVMDPAGKKQKIAFGEQKRLVLE